MTAETPIQRLGALKRGAGILAMGLLPIVLFRVYAQTFEPLHDDAWLVWPVSACVAVVALIKWLIRRAIHPALGQLLTSIVVGATVLGVIIEARDPYRRPEYEVAARWVLPNGDQLLIRHVLHPMGPNYRAARLILVRGDGIWRRSQAIAAPTGDFIESTVNFDEPLPEVAPNCRWSGTSTRGHPMGPPEFYDIDSLKFSDQCGPLKRAW